MSEQTFAIDNYIKKAFDIKDVDVRTYSPLTLAYIGDGVFDLIIRSVVVGKGNTKAANLHRRTSKIVKAETQSKMVEAIMDLLTEEEHDVFKRGRNAKSFTMAKNASMSDYRRATGFEALAGYLYVTDRFERLVELTKEGLKRLDIQL